MFARDSKFVMHINIYRVIKISGSFDKNDFGWLMSRCMSSQPKEVLAKFEDAMYVFPTYDLVQERNELLLIHNGQPIVEIKAIDVGNFAKPEDDVIHDDNFFLPGCLKLAVGAKVFLTSNMHINKGLYAGKRGTVTEITYTSKEIESDKTQPLLPEYVLVEFDDFAGKKLSEF